MYDDPVTGKTNGIKDVRWHHDHVIDFMIVNPTVSQGQIARQFKFSEGWVSLMVNSDAFQARLAERKAELVDPLIVASVDLRLKAVAQVSLDKMLEKLAGPLGTTDEFLLKSAELATKALGYGARQAGSGGSVNVAVVVQVPAKATESEWRAKYSAGPVVDVAPPPS